MKHYSDYEEPWLIEPYAHDPNEPDDESVEPTVFDGVPF
jgi:hypothetical protein